MTTRDGRVLCQLRDKKPGIDYPGYWTCAPGGHVRRGEKALDAMRREMKEEFGIRVGRAKFLGVLERARAGLKERFHFFTAPLTSPESGLKCHEGRRACFFTTTKALALRQHPMARRALKDYLKIKNAPRKRSVRKH